MANSTKPLSEEIAEVVRVDRRRNYWYAPGAADFLPAMPQMREFDAIEKYILAGWAPEAPFITPDQKITAFGSCFVSMLTDQLKVTRFEPPATRPVDSHCIIITETLVTTFALRQLFEWELEGIKPDADKLKSFRSLDINFSDDLWKKTISRIGDSDVYIIMFSSAEIWYDEPTGAVFWREVPGGDPARQKFRTSTVEENRANIRAIYDLMRKHRPEATLICAVSPIPMIATARPQSCITANAVSKSVLRVAVDEVFRDVGGDGYFHYWPIYDIVMEGFGATPYGGHFNGDRRHINDVALEYLMRLFAEYYCVGAVHDRSVLDHYVAARTDTTDLPPQIQQAVRSGDRRAIQHLIDRYQREDDAPTAELIARFAAEVLGPRNFDAAALTWQTAALVWRQLPALAPLGVAPQRATVPATAWDYGAVSDPVEASDGSDLIVRVTVEVQSGVVGVLLIRPDGSAITDVDRKVTPQDGPVDVDLRVYPADGPAHVLLRNYDSDGVPGAAVVREVKVAAAPPI